MMCSIWEVCIVKEQGIEKLTWLLRNKGSAESRVRCIDTLGRLGELQESPSCNSTPEQIGELDSS
eukprot:6166306-Amphidinium_carterae.1